MIQYLLIASILLNLAQVFMIAFIFWRLRVIEVQKEIRIVRNDPKKEEKHDAPAVFKQPKGYGQHLIHNTI